MAAPSRSPHGFLPLLHGGSITVPSRFLAASPWQLTQGSLTAPARVSMAPHGPFWAPSRSPHSAFTAPPQLSPRASPWPLTALSRFPHGSPITPSRFSARLSMAPHGPSWAPSRSPHSSSMARPQPPHGSPPPLHDSSQPFPLSLTVPPRLSVSPRCARPRRLLPFLRRPESAACSAAMEYLPAPAAPAQGHM